MTESREERDLSTVYVAEGIMAEEHLTGGRISEADAQVLAQRAAASLGYPRHAVILRYARQDDPYAGLDGQTIGHASGSRIVMNADKHPTKLDVLHETAHSVPTGDGGHGPAFRERAAVLYGRFISARAEQRFREIVGLPGGRERRRAARRRWR